VRLSVLALAALFLGGCILPLGGSQGRPDRGGPALAGGESTAGWKIVSRKIEPTYLIAADGSECTVSRERWENVRVGTRAFCVWN
jgi:hypothetical protein